MIDGKSNVASEKASHATPGASYAPTDCSALSDSEKVAVFEKHLRDLPWGYAHQEYGVPQEEPTLFARVFLWPRLWNWLRIHNKTEVEIDLLVRIAREMGYDFQEPNPSLQGTGHLVDRTLQGVVLPPDSDNQSERK